MSNQSLKNRGYIAVDLDGTLAFYQNGWMGMEHIGPPVPKMLARVRAWLAQGKQVKLLTARAAHPEYIPFIREWLDKHDLKELEITCVKDMNMIELWDDRAVQVIPNTGERADGRDE